MRLADRVILSFDGKALSSVWMVVIFLLKPFSVGPKTFLPSNKDLWPGLSIHKTFGFKEEYDRTDAGFPISFQGHTFPSLDEGQREQAKVEMLKLAHKVGIEGL